MAREAIVKGGAGDEEEKRRDAALRPRFLREVIGQKKVLQRLNIVLKACKKLKEPLSHILFDGPPGLGKTTFATVLPPNLEAFRRAGLIMKELTQILGIFQKKREIKAGVKSTLKIAGEAKVIQVLSEESLLEGVLKLHQAAGQASPDNARDLNALVHRLIELRAEARKTKNFALGDQIRKGLADLGIILKDRPDGKTEWSRAG